MGKSPLQMADRVLLTLEARFGQVELYPENLLGVKEGSQRRFVPFLHSSSPFSPFSPFSLSSVRLRCAKAATSSIFIGYWLFNSDLRNRTPRRGGGGVQQSSHTHHTPYQQSIHDVLHHQPHQIDPGNEYCLQTKAAPALELHDYLPRQLAVGPKTVAQAAHPAWRELDGNPTCSSSLRGSRALESSRPLRALHKDDKGHSHPSHQRTTVRSSLASWPNLSSAARSMAGPNPPTDVESRSHSRPADHATPSVETPPSEMEIDIEKLGRQRPAVFKTMWAELGFIVSLLGSMLMAEFFVSGFHVILPPLAIELSIPEASQTWPASVFALVAGSFLLPFGRLADMYGGYAVFNAGLLWFCLWCLVAGFSRNYVMLIACRALQGLAAAAFLPAGIMLLAQTYRPGPRKNVFFALYGASAPLGFFLGILFGGITGEFLDWRWYFWLGCIILAVVCAVALLSVPNDWRPAPPPGGGGAGTAAAAAAAAAPLTMDWAGFATIVPGLVLVVYAFTDSSQAPNGWASSQTIVPLVLGLCLLAAAFWVERRYAVQPLVPAEIFAPRHMKRLVAALFCGYGTFGVFLLYSTFYIELVLHMSPLLTAVWYVPLIVGGLVIACLGGFTLHLLPGRVLLVLAGLGNVGSVVLFALMPEDPNYWAWVFPAMVCSTVGIDITFTVTNVFITTNLPARWQGLAGALINSTLFLGISFFLGLAEVAVGQTSHLGLRENYQVAFWFATGIAGVALLLFVFIDPGQAKSQLTVEERARLEGAAGRIDPGDEKTNEGVDAGK
ncbi:MFS general substrate transporter [Sodiomyces alkalinus F11]|uniref:MFS general substrate transporter n=1 Tax=Sodiomyces alkalinus (strain CBS 110278 / VKM F-3762 / F11) TaxID=1314773 RepID=A0A3N2QAI8_SODAK|nr:MFS general substrate transporter [Sodiomyces alkalinus F11]ROT43773.1 MFS general substrate transporter [Sodiomyces alkalinus F11]